MINKAKTQPIIYDNQVWNLSLINTVVNDMSVVVAIKLGVGKQ